MGVKYANAHFSIRTVSAKLDFYSGILNCKEEIEEKILTVLQFYLGTTLQTKYSNTLIVKSQKDKNISLYAKSGILCLQFRAYAGALYNDIYMKINEKSSGSNIILMEISIRHILHYLQLGMTQETTEKTSQSGNKQKIGKNCHFTCDI